jgi:hypothetical protein
VFGRAPKNAGDRDSESGEWIKKTSIFTTSKDVEQIVDHFNIQGACCELPLPAIVFSFRAVVNCACHMCRVLCDCRCPFVFAVSNPCILMTQDMAREFLTSKKEGDLYRLFMKATLLEPMIERLSKAQSETAEWTGTLSKHRAQVPMAEQAMELARKVWLFHKRIHSHMYRMHTQCDILLVWRSLCLYYVTFQDYEDARSLERYENDLATMRIENICAQVYELEDGANEAVKLVEGFETQLAAVRDKIAEQMAHVRHLEPI